MQDFFKGSEEPKKNICVLRSPLPSEGSSLRRPLPLALPPAHVPAPRHGVEQLLQRLELRGATLLEQVLHAPADVAVHARARAARTPQIVVRRRQVLRPRVTSEADPAR